MANVRSTPKRVQIVFRPGGMGCRHPATARRCGRLQGHVMKLVAGDRDAAFATRTRRRNLTCKRLRLTKLVLRLRPRRERPASRWPDTFGVGEVWTVHRDRRRPKLMRPSWLGMRDGRVRPRSSLQDLAGRLVKPGGNSRPTRHKMYISAVEGPAFAGAIGLRHSSRSTARKDGKERKSALQAPPTAWVPQKPRRTGARTRSSLYLLCGAGQHHDPVRHQPVHSPEERNSERRWRTIPLASVSLRPLQPLQGCTRNLRSLRRCRPGLGPVLVCEELVALLPEVTRQKRGPYKEGRRIQH